MAFVKNDDVDALRNLFEVSETRAGTMQAHYNNALRISAMHGSIHCLNYILASGQANILDPGRGSIKIPLHYALEQEDMDCALMLLQATDILDFYDPAGQLLFGEKPDRPIDVIDRMEDDTKKLIIVDAIEKLLMVHYGVNTNQAQRDEIDKMFQSMYLEKVLLSF